jgi:hypothetical protein
VRLVFIRCWEATTARRWWRRCAPATSSASARSSTTKCATPRCKPAAACSCWWWPGERELSTTPIQHDGCSPCACNGSIRAHWSTSTHHHFPQYLTPPAILRFLSEGSSLSPGKGLQHQRSSSHATVPLSDASPLRSSQFGHFLTGACCTAPTPSTVLRITHHADTAETLPTYGPSLAAPHGAAAVTRRPTPNSCLSLPPIPQSPPCAFDPLPIHALQGSSGRKGVWLLEWK